jgi:Ca2+-binding RTX toxin-like protein
MASVSGSQLAFFVPGKSNSLVNVVLTATGADLPTPIAGDFNIEVFTQTAGNLAFGYDADAFIQGAVHLPYNVVQASSLASTEQLLSGGYGVVDLLGNDTIQLDSPGADTVVGATGDTIIGNTSFEGSTNQYYDASAGGITVIGGKEALDTIVGGVGDNITGGGGADTVDGSRGSQTITGGIGPLNVLGTTVAGVPGDTIVIGTSAGSDIYGGIGDSIIGGSFYSVISDLIATNVFGSRDTIVGGLNSMTVWGAAGDSILGASQRCTAVPDRCKSMTLITPEPRRSSAGLAA